MDRHAGFYPVCDDLSGRLAAVNRFVLRLLVKKEVRWGNDRAEGSRREQVRLTMAGTERCGEGEDIRFSMVIKR